MASPLSTTSIEHLLTTLIERFESIKMERCADRAPKIPMQAEIRSLDFWRSIVAECLASFFLVFVVCGSCVPWSGHTAPAIGIALAAGFSVASLTLSFAHISGAHINPVVSLALLVTRKVSPMKAFLYVTAQGGGSIAGAALLYGVTSAGHQGSLGATTVSAGLSEWQGLGIELCLTFVIVLVYLTTMDDNRRILPAAIGPGPLTLGLTYTACSFVALPTTGASFNPMRSLGPAFVMNKWDAHWVYWLGPIVGGCLAGILYEFIFNPYRNSAHGRKESVGDGDSSSIHSDEDNYDDVKSTVANYQSARSHHYDQYRPAISPGGALSALSPGGATGNNWRNTQRMLERAESVYGGTKSLYNAPCPSKSPGPPSHRGNSGGGTNLNRSQSVYAKPPANPATLPPGGSRQHQQSQLQSAQSTYLARNVDLIRTESIYAARPTPIYGQHQRREPDNMLSPREPQQPIYGTRAVTSHQQQERDRSKPESYQLEPIYGTRREMVVTSASIEPSQRSQPSESLYGRNPKAPSYSRQASATEQTMETSSSSATTTAPISPSDTSKDSAYGSVHGPAHHPHHHDWSGNSGHHQSSFQPYQSASSAGNGHVYAQKFRSDLISPGHHHSAGQQHSPSQMTPGSAFHSPVQY